MSITRTLSTMAVALTVGLGVASTAHAQQFFRIGTGGTAGTYYPVGGMIANAVSQPGNPGDVGQRAVAGLRGDDDLARLTDGVGNHAAHRVVGDRKSVV